jgi:beta-glucosidase
MSTLKFPEKFIWGAATSSYQIEGAWDLHGKGESIWDRFSNTTGKIEDRSTGQVACDHYVRWQDDVALLKTLGLSSYRFSISWPRILPSGTGKVNQTGLDFYSRLVDELLENNITPNATLYHWDLPQVLEERGGWPSRMIVDIFVEYVDVVTRYLGDRVKMWATINEPWVVAKLGYEFGNHAPGHRDRLMAVNAAHHLLLAHGKAVPVIRENSPQSDVGIVLNLIPYHPATLKPADREVAKLADGDLNRWYLDALAGFGYPSDVLNTYQGEFDGVEEGDMAVIAEPIDFLGINYYTRSIIGTDSSADNNLFFHVLPEESEITEMGWEVFPPGLFDVLMRAYNHYGFQRLYVCENGAAFPDKVSSDGRVHDARRVAYFYEHLQQAHRAISAGVPLEGFYAWSLMDNFEWAHGYTMRFGLVYVDYETQQRILKDSAYYYRQVIKANAVLEPDVRLAVTSKEG